MNCFDFFRIVFGSKKEDAIVSQEPVLAENIFVVDRRQLDRVHESLTSGKAEPLSGSVLPYSASDSSLPVHIFGVDRIDAAIMAHDAILPSVASSENEVAQQVANTLEADSVDNSQPHQNAMSVEE